MGRLIYLSVVLAAALLTCAAGELIKVGGRVGWRPNVNYTAWASHRRFYVGQWLYFVFDKRYYSVLEVNRWNYEQCKDDQFITNITRGGRDVFNLTEPRPYYFLSSGGYCYDGMKFTINVHEQPPRPKCSSAAKNAAKPIDPLVMILISFLFAVAWFRYSS